MINQKMALLGAAALGVMGGAFVSPAQAVAIRYDITGGAFDAGGVLTGSFFYDSATTTYSDFNITSTSTTMAPLTAPSPFANPFTYTSVSAQIGTASSADSLVLRAPTNTAFPFRRLTLLFDTSLTGVFGTSANLIVDPNNPTDGSYEQYSANGQILIGSVSGGTVTAVPWETDALSVIGVTTLFGFGVWTKRKRKVDISK